MEGEFYAVGEIMKMLIYFAGLGCSWDVVSVAASYTGQSV
jgi:hypothetical protein